ncbi:hypothetical protein Lser_V15G21286 [Lactuca serriola]
MSANPPSKSKVSKYVLEYSKEINSLLGNRKSSPSSLFEDPKTVLKIDEEPSSLKAAWELLEIFYANKQSQSWIPKQLVDWLTTQRYTLHGHWLQTSTATGRLSMEDPNLQWVKHMVEFKIDSNEKEGDDSDMEPYKVNPRDFFIPTQENWLLVTADYSQIELRLMAHFSKDQSLIDLLTKTLGDVFNMITTKWSGKEESLVGPKERDQTKRLIYGILYGMGANSLAEQLEWSSDDARDKI